MEMKRTFIEKAALVASAAAIGAGFLAVPLVASAVSQPFYYGVWLPFWQSQNGASDISLNLNVLHEVSPFSYAVRTNGTLVDDLNIGNGSWDPWFSAVRSAGAKIVPTVAWLDGSTIKALLANGPQRRALEDRIATLAANEKFDGIDIDFEGMPTTTRPYFSLFIEGAAMRLHAAGRSLACTVTPRTPLSSLYDSAPLPTVIYAENYTVLNQYCDEVRVMAYDQGTIDITLDASKGDGTLYAPVADPAWVRKVIQQTIAYINPKKVMLGIPTYGYEYQVSWNMGATTYERVRSFDFFDAMDRAEENGVEPSRNNAGELSFTFASSTHISGVPLSLTAIVASTLPAALAPGLANAGASTTFFVSFSDAQSTADKIKLAKEYGLRGAILFKADGQVDPAIWGVMH